jgi:hypothetical protein
MFACGVWGIFVTIIYWERRRRPTKKIKNKK